MDRELIGRILDAYGVPYVSIHSPQKGYRNNSYAVQLQNNEWANVILYKNEPSILDRIHRVHKVTDEMMGSGLPVRHTIDPRIMMLRTGPVVRYAALYNYLPGQTIPWEAYTKNHIKLVGMAMSNLHSQLKRTGKVDNHVSDEYLAINKRMERYFSQPGVSSAMRRKLQVHVDELLFSHLARVLALCAHLPNQQVVHMDFVRGNLLFSAAKPGDTLAVGITALTGIIDFEKVAYGHPVFDIARTLAFLLIDCKHKPASKIRKHFLYSGYKKRGDAKLLLPIVTDSSKALDLLRELTTLFLVYDFYKFLRHNPYESLDQNEHFVRTRDALIERAVLQLVN